MSTAAIKYYYEYVSAAYADNYGESVNKIIEPIGRALQWLFIYIIPFFIGARAENLVQSIPLDSSIFDFEVWLIFWKDYWVLIPLVILFFIGLIGRNKVEYSKAKIRSIHDALSWMYDDLNFNDEQFKDADIRCTIWAPVKRKQKIDNFRMRQLVDYVPQYSRSANRQIASFRKNKASGRVFRFSKNIDDEYKPIGIVGLCAIEFETGQTPQAYREVIPDEVNFEEYMFENWYFNKSQAGRLTSDRRAYICVPLMDRNASSLYGIIYIDSREANALPASVGTTIMKGYLARISGLFTS